MIEIGIVAESWRKGFRVAKKAEVVSVGNLAGGEEEVVHPYSVDWLLIVLADIRAHPEGAGRDREEDREETFGLGKKFCCLHEFVPRLKPEFKTVHIAATKPCAPATPKKS